MYLLMIFSTNTLCEVTILECHHKYWFLSLSLLSIVPDDDISVEFRPLRALLVGERIVQFEL